MGSNYLLSFGSFGGFWRYFYAVSEGTIGAIGQANMLLKAPLFRDTLLIHSGDKHDHSAGFLPVSQGFPLQNRGLFWLLSTSFLGFPLQLCFFPQAF